LLLRTPDAHALQALDGKLGLTGTLRTTNLVRHADFDRLAFIQQRNALRLIAEWSWLEGGKAFGRRSSWLESSKAVVSWRGAYDSVYDFEPGMIERKDLQGDPLDAGDAALEALGEHRRDEIKLEGVWRDAYLEMEFRSVPLTLRIGKQQIVWGQSDGLRVLDRANTLDLGWHFFQELPPPAFSFDEIRQPFFMVRATWRFPDWKPVRLREPFLEFYWNPGDWSPDKVKFVPRPWGLRILNPLLNTAGTGVFQSTFCINATRDGVRGVCEGLLDGTSLFTQGDWDRNPIDNSQFGVRLHFITPGDVEMTLNYYYQRVGLDGSPVANVRGLSESGSTLVSDTNGFIPGAQPGEVPNPRYCEGLARTAGDLGAPWAASTLCLEYFAPYVHTFGTSLSHFDARWTSTVWRLETLVDFDLPFYDGDKQTALFARSPNGPILVPGITKKNMWKGVLAFDRPTWIRALNTETQFFITGQFFWHYLIGHERRRCAIDDDPANGYTSSPTENCGSDTDLLLPGEQVGLVGPLDLPKLDQLASVRTRDTIHQWEMLGTIAIAGFYRNSTLVPAIMYMLDPVNSYSQEFMTAVDWYLRPDLSLNVTTRLIWAGAPWDAYQGHDNDGDVDRGEIFDPWFIAGGSRGRSETGVAITWQF
jgi:hypothetical protein